MLLKKYKQEQLFNSNPKIFLIFELLSVNNEKFTAMKKNLNEKGFKVKYLRTKETLGILRNFKHLKKEHFVQSKNLFKSTLICIYLKTNFDNVMENGVTNQIEHLVNGLAFGEDFYEKYRLVLVGMYFEGLFYNPKALLCFCAICQIAITGTSYAIGCNRGIPASSARLLWSWCRKKPNMLQVESTCKGGPNSV